MSSPVDPDLNQLSGADERTFERGIQSLNRRWVGANHAERLLELSTVLKGFGKSTGLGATEVSRRVRLVVEAAKLPDSQQRALASSLNQLPATVRQAVTSSLPPQLRRLVYAPQRAPTVGVTQGSAAQSMSEPLTAATGEILTPETPPRPRDWASVILLGTFADHEENRLALEKKGFAPLRATSIDQLNEYLDNDVCGVVVGRSWWPGIPEIDREGVLNRILGHSSFIWLKFDTHNLPCSAERFNELLVAARHTVPLMHECICHDGWRLTPHDLLALEQIRDILANADAVRLCPADIQEPQARVLIGAAIKHVRQRNFSGPFRLTRVEADLIPGGRSFARIIRMAPDDDGAPLVAKVDEVTRLSDEMGRFKRYVQRWDTELNPQLHYHAGTSLIIFGLVESPESPGRPAPTLEEKLETMFYCEHYPDPYQGPDEQELRELIARAIRKLQRLNAQPSDAAFPRKTYTVCEPYNSLRRLGVKWNVGYCDGSDGEVFDFVDMAQNRVDAMSERVIVHGDVQLRNILVRDGREPHFIDYANCGPGHPCFDLVRLESAVLFFCGRMNGDERELAAVLLDILNGRIESEIAQAHPLFFTSRTNRLAISTSIACRTAAIETVLTIGGTEDDYLAMKFVVTCQSLFMIHLQSGVVRSQLVALGSFLRSRPAWNLAPMPSGTAEFEAKKTDKSV